MRNSRPSALRPDRDEITRAHIRALRHRSDLSEEDLHDYRLSLQARVSTALQEMREHLDSMPSSPLESRPRPDRKLRAVAPWALGYLGVLAYVIGFMYRVGYFNVLLPSYSVGHGYFETVSTLTSLLPILLLLAYAVTPWYLSSLRVSESVRQHTAAMFHASHRLDHYTGLLHVYGRTLSHRFCSDCRAKRWCRSRIRELLQLWRDYFASRRASFQLRKHFRGILGWNWYVPIALTSRTSVGGVLLLSQLPLLSTWVLLRLIDSRMAGYPYTVYIVTVFLLVLTAWLLLLAYRTWALMERDHMRMSLQLMSALYAVAFLITASISAGHSSAHLRLSHLPQEPNASITLVDGRTLSGWHISTASDANGIFFRLDDGRRLVRFERSAVVSIEVTPSDVPATRGLGPEIERFLQQASDSGIQ